MNEPIKIGSKTEVEATCLQCGKVGIASDFFTYHGQKKGEDSYLCATCREQVKVQLEEEAKSVNMWRAFAYGAGAAIVSGAIWYAFTLGSNMEYGIIAIGVGYLVAVGVFHGAGKKRSRKLQILSALLALVAILGAKFALFMHFVNEDIRLNPGEYSEDIDIYSPLGIAVTVIAFTTTLADPIGILIIAFGVYFAYSHLKPIKI
ncbi:MAG: hypothetical protein WCJ29_02495 [bacterium]